MAGRRMGFEGVFSPLYAVEHIRTGLLDGTLSVLKLFVEGVIPILDAAAIDLFKLMEAVRLRSPLLDRTYIQTLTEQYAAVERVGSATQALLAIFNDADPLICDVVDVLMATHLLPVPERLEAAFRLALPLNLLPNLVIEAF
jgi:DNA helicase-2/ATP-dependent DNA helicase PcrA